jgi:hypothetical protein
MPDIFQFLTAGLESPASDAFDITPSDATNLESVTRGIYCGAGGHLHVIMKSGREITFKNLAGEMTHGLRVSKVFLTGTTATDIIGLL